MIDDKLANYAKLIKEGRYKEVIKYLDEPEAIEDNINNQFQNEKLSDMSVISNFNEISLEQLGYDKELIGKIQNLNKINKELQLHKEYIDHDNNFESVNDSNMNLNIDLVEISDFSKIENFDESKFEDKMNQSLLCKTLHKDKDLTQINNLDEFKNSGDGLIDYNREIDNDNNLMFNLQKLLHEDEENANRFMQLKENICMQNEEIYGNNFQMIERAKRFPYKDCKLKSFSEIFKRSNQFKKEYIHHSIKMNVNKHFSNVDENFKPLVDITTEFADLSDYDLTEAEILKEIKLTINESENYKNKNSHLKNLIERNNSTNLFTDFLNCNKNGTNLKNSKIKNKINSQMEKIYSNFESVQFKADNKNSAEGKVSKNFLELHLNSKIKSSQDQEENSKLFEVIKSWNKNFFADSQRTNNCEKSNLEFEEKNLKTFNNYFINSFATKIQKAKKQDSTNLSRISSSCLNTKNFQIKNENLLELNLASKNITKIDSEFFKNFINLITLNLEENLLTKIENLQDFKNLITLNLNKNKISVIENLKENSNLEKLYLNGNQIQKIQNLQFNKKLKSLSLGRNRINSISDIEFQLPFIEELTLCENLIKNIPENFSLPFLKFFDLNDNKISYLNFYLCPNLEKLFLKDNKIKLFPDENSDRLLDGKFSKFSFKFCPKLKEIDLSFNKIENFSDLLICLEDNKNLEVMNINNNSFSIDLKGIVKIEKILIKIFPNLKTVDNESINLENSKNSENSNLLKKFEKNNKIPHLLISYFNIFNFQHQFMKFFNSVFHVNNIFNSFNFNQTSQNEKVKLHFLNLINRNYFMSKEMFLRNLEEFLKDRKNDYNCEKFYFYFNKNTQIQNILMKYLYQLKYRMEYLLNSFQYFKIILKKKKILKIQKLQRFFRSFVYSKKLKEKLSKVKFDYEEESNEELLNFFTNRDKLHTTKNIERKFDLIVNSNRQNFVSQIPEEKLQINFSDFNVDQEFSDDIRVFMNKEKLDINSVSVSNSSSNLILRQSSKLDTSEINSTPNKNKNLRHSSVDINLINMNKEIPKNPHQIEDRIKLLEKKLKNGEANFESKINTFANPVEQNFQKMSENPNKQLTTIKENYSLNGNNHYHNSNHISSLQRIPYDHKIDSINIINILDNADLPKISQKPSSNVLQSQSIQSINRKDQQFNNIILPAIAIKNTNPIEKVQKNSNEIMTHQSQDSISIKNNSKVITAVKQISSSNKNQFLSLKLQEQIKHIEQDCKTAIKNAKEEWKFNNPQTEELLCNKIKKQYKRKIDKLMQGVNHDN